MTIIKNSANKMLNIKNSINGLMVIACTVSFGSVAFSDDICPDDQGVKQFNPANHARCETLWPTVENPSNPDGTVKQLNVYEAQADEFFAKYCHRDPLLTENGQGWGQDKELRDLGPFIASQDVDGNWQGKYFGFHSPVVIWYSPNMIEWLKVNRPQNEEDTPDVIEPVPDGAIIVKEMYTPPGSRCRDKDIENLQPAHGIAYMVRDAKVSFDGWFWGYFGYHPEGTPDPNIDWPRPLAARKVKNAPNYSQFGAYCVNCHASAVDNSTFSTLDNVAGFKGTPLVYLSQDWFLRDFEGTSESNHAPLTALSPSLNNGPLDEVPESWLDFFALPADQKPYTTAEITLPSQAYDSVWVNAPIDAQIPLSSEYVTSDQCLGCHDAGSTGLQFDMTKPNPHGANLINLSPYATWRTSPMGLAGRDPIFFGQVASEEEFHPDYLDTVWNTCFGCHGIMGQRQFQLDEKLAGTSCEDSVFLPEYFTAIPYDDGSGTTPSGPHFDAKHAKYGALARDGISCTACHRAVLTHEETEVVQNEPQNSCVLARQKLLNEDIGDLKGFGKTFTGSFLVTGPDKLKGPFENPKVKPMQHALGNTPVFDPSIASSEQCGTCHTVHLPVLWPKEEGSKSLNVLGDTYEQTTYPEWLFSEFRTGEAAFSPLGQTLPGGAGQTPQSCADCHMESHDASGAPYISKIAAIQENTNFQEVENVLDGKHIDLESREGFARHTLVGLNLFLIKMAEDFPDILGLSLSDPMLGAKGLDPIERTKDRMIENAQVNTADLTIESTKQENGQLFVDVKVTNKAGHKFPSGVAFRRAFLEFEVLDTDGNVQWHSGRTNEYGILIDKDDKPLKGELWYDLSCKKIVGQTDFQPHYQQISDPDMVQIYQEIKLDPGDPKQVKNRPTCEKGSVVEASANMTTSFLSICHTPKDNRLLPAGDMPESQRLEIASLMGLGPKEAASLVEETYSIGTQGDPDYLTGGSDSLTYEINVMDLPKPAAKVRATLHYQATPPFYLQDRFCNGSGVNHDRLYHISSHLKTEGTPIEDWKFTMVSAEQDLN